MSKEAAQVLSYFALLAILAPVIWMIFFRGR